MNVLVNLVGFFTRIFYKKNVFKKMRLKWPKSYENLTKIVRTSYENRTKILRKSYENHNAQFPTVSVFVTSLLHSKVKKISRKSQAQFREKLRKLRLMQNDGLSYKKRELL